MSPEIGQPDASVFREDFLEQPGLFDYATVVTGNSNPLVLTTELSLPAAGRPQTLAEYWLGMLDSDTTLGEVFYLLGVEDATDNAERVANLLNHATDIDFAVGRGETLGDLQASGLSNLYEQLFQPQLRPKQTPSGEPFPYTSFEDAETRTARLRDIKHKMSLHPDTVVNMGSGYDVTPSDAFPDARVVHVDIEPEIVEFLRRAGFEAYQPDELPEDLAADLIIDVLGPGQGAVPLAPRGMMLTTQKHVPEGMTVTGVVPSTRYEILPLVTETKAVQAALRSFQLDKHLLVLQQDT